MSVSQILMIPAFVATLLTSCESGRMVAARPDSPAIARVESQNGPRNLRSTAEGGAGQQAPVPRAVIVQTEDGGKPDITQRSRERIVERVESRHGVNLSPESEISTLLDQEARLSTVKRLKDNFGQTYDYQTTELATLLDIEARSNSAKRLTAKSGKVVGWNDYSLGKLLEMERGYTVSHPTSAAVSAKRNPIFPTGKNSIPASSYPVGSSRYYDSSYRPSVGDHYVSGYYRSDGTYVAAHRKTNRDDSFWNNWSSEGNTNPYTGRTGSKTPGSRYPSYSSGGSTTVRGYYRKDGTYVRSHRRRSR